MNPRPKLNAVNAKRMVGDLTSGRTLMWVGVALVIHLVLIGATSVGYIRDKWIDPAGAQARHEAQANADAKPPMPATQPAAPGAATQRGVVTKDLSEQQILEQRKDSKVVRDITEPAKPSEIPKEPSRGGFDLDEKLN